MCEMDIKITSQHRTILAAPYVCLALLFPHVTQFLPPFLALSFNALPPHKTALEGGGTSKGLFT